MRPVLVVSVVLAVGCGSSGSKDLPPVATFDGGNVGPTPNTGAGAPGDGAAADAVADLAAGEVGQSGPPDASPPGDVPPTTSPDTGTADGPGAAADLPPPRPVTMQFAGTVVTVARRPLGFDDTIRTTPITGTFTYDLRTPDALPGEPKRGRYEHGTTSGFTFTFLGHTIEGSGYAIVQTEDLGSDTFRFLDGPQGDTVPRIMKLDGTPAPTLELSIAITDGMGAALMGDALPDPFPTLDITRTPHTFSIEDSGGTMLMQLTSLTMK